MKKRKLKKEVKVVLLGSCFACLVGALFLATDQLTYQEPKDSLKYVSDTIFDDVVPVVSSDTKMIRPYLDSSLTIIKGFYDYQGEAEAQIKSLIYHDNTYMQNSGVAYGGKDNFDVVAVLDGTVTKVEDNDLLGKTIEITHDNNIISIYQSLGEVSVKKDDVVKQGTAIGKSGTCSIDSELGSHLHFELFIDGELVNPENYYDQLLENKKEQ